MSLTFLAVESKKIDGQKGAETASEEEEGRQF